MFTVFMQVLPINCPNYIYSANPQTSDSYFKGLFVDVYVISSFDLFGLAEEYEVFKQEDVAEIFPPSTPDYELILAVELTLLF